MVATAKQAIADGVVREGALPEVLLEVPPKKEFGDFASNFAMQSARTLRCNPRILATYIQEHLSCPYVEKVDIAGPGFLNFHLKPDWMYDMFSHIVEAGETYGNLPKASQEKSSWNSSAPTRRAPCTWDTAAAPPWAVPWRIC